MRKEESIWSIRFKVGVFTLMGLFLVAALSVYVNDRPFWWRPCQLIHINVPDATGLKVKSPIRSLGLQIGFLKTVQLYEDRVKLGICITAPVKVLPETRAFIRGEGFLGDKFVELKPVRYTGDREEEDVIEKKHEDWGPQSPTHSDSPANDSPQDQSHLKKANPGKRHFSLSSLLPPHVWAGALVLTSFAQAQQESKEVPVENAGQGVQELVNEMDGLVTEIKDVTKTLNYAIKPKELRDTLQKLNKTLEHAQTAFAPDGGMTTTAQRTLIKLEDAIEQFRDQMTRVNQGKGSVGMLLNDPSYADEIRQAVRNLNTVLGRVSALRIMVNLFTEFMPAYDSGRGGISIGIWPQRDRYYLLGLSVDPRGLIVNKTVTVASESSSTTTNVTETQTGGILITGMIGKVFWRRLDLAAGFLYGDGAVSIGVNLGSYGFEDRFSFVTNVYAQTRTATPQVDARLHLNWFPTQSPYLKNVYLYGGLESVRRVNNQIAYTVGAGVSFNDQDIKMLFSLL